MITSDVLQLFFFSVTLQGILAENFPEVSTDIHAKISWFIDFCINLNSCINLKVHKFKFHFGRNAFRSICGNFTRYYFMNFSAIPSRVLSRNSSGICFGIFSEILVENSQEFHLEEPPEEFLRRSLEILPGIASWTSLGIYLFNPSSRNPFSYHLRIYFLVFLLEYI